ncbi:MAG: hypothetical protein IJZ42_12225 [Lachnospiraceae bacterium]|nr:hypothetical protein [Lachnospiraceae bacterium]
MKRYVRMKRRFGLGCTAILLCMLIGLPLSVKAENVVLSYDLYHKHIPECTVTMYKTISADGEGWLRTVSTDTCACGGYHDYYEFDVACSCGQTWHATGHACVNSKYGTNQGTCTNYSYIDCSTEHSHPYTDYGCGKTEDSVIATVIVTGDITSPAKSVNLKATSTGEAENMKLTWQGTNDSAQLKAEKNGTYVLYASYTENGISYMEQMSVEVNNIDRESPIVGEIILSERRYTRDNIFLSIEADDTFGLPVNYISWNGEAYGANNRYEVTENGTYEVTVQDIAGNTVKKEITVNNIDKKAPEITSLIADPMPWYSGSCIVTVSAQDDEKSGSGLDDMPYSWDGGKTWTDEANYELSHEGTVTVQVRDRAGNMSEESIKVVQEELPEPESEVIEEPSEPKSEVIEEPSEPKSEVIEEPSEPKNEVVEEPSEPKSETVERPSESKSEVSEEVSAPKSEMAEESLESESEVSEETSELKSEVTEEISELESELQEDISETENEVKNEQTGMVTTAPEMPTTQENLTSELSLVKETQTWELEQESEKGEIKESLIIPEDNVEKKVSIEEVDYLFDGSNHSEADTIKKEPNMKKGRLVHVVSIVSGVSTVGFLFILLYRILGMCSIYEEGEDKQYKLLGKAAIRKRQKIYEVLIPMSMVEKAFSRTLKIVLPAWFVHKKEFKQIKIFAGKTVKDAYVEKEITFRIKE